MENNRGLELASAIVPVVGAAVVFDLIGPDNPRPGPTAGRMACEAATNAEPDSGRVGVGRGASWESSRSRIRLPGGQGSKHRPVWRSGLGAIVAVNAFGDVLNSDGSVLKGSSAAPENPRYPAASIEEVAGWEAGEEKANTTIGCLVTNARLTKAEACRVADLSHTDRSDN